SSVSFAGLGALLCASARAFLVLRWAGAAYLVYLALRLWRLAPRPVAAAGVPAPDEERLVTQTFFLMLLNPNALTFFIALAPQFLDEAAPLVPQLAAMLATRSEEHTSELQSRENLVCRLLLDKK